MAGPPLWLFFFTPGQQVDVFSLSRPLQSTVVSQGFPSCFFLTSLWVFTVRAVSGDSKLPAAIA